MNGSHFLSPGSTLRLLGATLWLTASLVLPASAFDGAGSGGDGGGGGGEPPPEGGSAPPPPTYYESALGGQPLESLETSVGGLPTSLHIDDASGAAWYQAVGDVPDGSLWRLEAEVDERPVERVDAVYDVVVAIPLPVGAESGATLAAREGTAARSVALVYADEKVLLKRNVALERTWIPLLGGAAGGLPDLSGTGYEFTLWDTILRLDASVGDSLQTRGSLDYTAASGVSGPDPDDPGFGVYIINWIPTLDPGIPPYTLRIDVVPAP